MNHGMRRVKSADKILDFHVPGEVGVIPLFCHLQLFGILSAIGSVDDYL
jgi:hypothetical protein